MRLSGLRARRASRSKSRRATYAVEPLESRTLLSVGPIPTVPVPAAHWTFDDGSGTTAADSSGNGHTGRLGTGVSWVAGNVGTGAISLNGASTAVVTVTGPVVNTAQSFTVSAWVNLASLSGYQTFVSIAGTNVAGFFLQLRGDTGTFALSMLSSDADGTATYVADPTAPVTGVWYHLVGVDNATAGTLTLYVDGQSMGSTPFTSNWQANGNTLIGHGFYSGGQVDYVDGSIDDVQMFSSALSAAQVAALDEPAAYSFDDGTGTTAADVSGHGNMLTLGSGATWAAGYIGSNSLAVNGTATGNATNPSPVINTALPFSVSAWVNLNSLSGYQTFVSIDGTNTSGFYLQLAGDTGNFSFSRLASDSDSATAYRAEATFTPSTGVWYNLIGVNDPATGQILLYVDGVLQSSTSYTGGWQALGPTVVGGGKFNGTRTDFVNGEIDNVVFYNSPLSAADANYIASNGNSAINIATGTTGVTVSPNLFGAFMENINYDSDGGMDNNEVQNSGFNDSTNALNAWSAIASAGVTANLSSDTTTGPTSALTQSGKLTITSGVSATARVGISNSGYFGVAIAPSTSYSVIFYAKASPGFTGPLTVDLESTTGTVWATATISSITGSWAEYTATLTTGPNTPTTATNLFVISTNSTSANGATIWFGATYVYPPSYDDANNHLRVDLMEMLAQLKPAVFRVPGGNYLEGNTYATRFEWSNTVGPVQDRPGHYDSAWGYWSTDGMGLDEYLQMAEEVGASPILAVYAGYTLNGTSDTGATLAADVTDAVDELHYVLDPVTTSWGAERAANGHPAPYNVQDVEIGNEDFFSSTYSTRYPLFYNAIHAAFPSLQIIATSTDTGGSPYNVLDEHFYESPAWFEANSNYFNTVARTGTQIFIGEYASNEGSPTGDMNSALGDASWLLGLERNSDLVTMSSYAPLFVNVDSYEWAPDLIGFNDTTSYGSPSYWEQVMLSNNHGTTVVSDTVSGATGLQTLVTRTGNTYYLTVINTLGTANTTSVTLSGAASVSSTATVTSLIGSSSTATNSITDPDNIVPVTSTVSSLGPNFTYTFAGYSITVMQFNAYSGPTVQTAAAANPSPVTGTTTNLSALGAENGSDSGLTYTWSYTGPSGVTYTGNTNGTNAAKNIIANFTQAGSYDFIVTITDAGNNSITSSVNVTVQQTPTMVRVSPSNSPVVPVTFTQQFTASATDQFGNAISAPSFTWSIAGSGNSIDNTGKATLGSTAGSFTVTATDGTAKGNATVIAESFAVPSGLTLDVNLSAAGPVSLSASGSNITASQNGVQITLAGFTGITVSETGSNDVLNFNGPLALPFNFVNTGTSTVNVNSSALTFAAVPGGNVSLGTLSVASGSDAVITATITQQPTTLSLTSLAIGSSGYLDLANNVILIHYTPGNDPITTIRQYLTSGRYTGSWNGPGIDSSQANLNSQSYSLGYADSADPGNPANLATGTIEIKYTLLGDANLNGTVDGTDFGILAANFNKGVTGWDLGDFNYDNVVDGTDLGDLNANFNKGANIAAAAPPVTVTLTPTGIFNSSRPAVSKTPAILIAPVTQKASVSHAKAKRNVSR